MNVKMIVAALFWGVGLMSVAYSVRADLTYPVDHTAQWQLIDTTDCSTVGGLRSWPALDPDTYDCDTEPCGIDPGYPANFAMLQVQGAGAFPDYDSNLSRVESPYLVCGQNVSTCYDPECTTTDTFQQVHRVVDLNNDQRKINLRNVASESISAHFATDEFTRDLAIMMSLLSRIVDGQTLPTDVQGINMQTVYDNTSTRFQSAADPNIIRYFNLLDRINAGTIQDGEIGTGWTLP
jgi:hypothetical protein